MAEDRKESEKIARCAMCADMCKYSCPTFLATGKETLSPQKVARLILYDDKGFLEDENSALKLMFQTAMCGACRVHCIYNDYDLRKFVHRKRVEAFQRDVLPEDVRRRVETFKRFGNPDGQRELIERGAGDTGYFVSCSSYKDEDLLKAADKVFSSSKLAVRWFGGGDLCCGAPLYYAGDVAGFRAVALKMGTEFEARGLRRIVVDCPTCVLMMTRMYREVGVPLDVEIMHTTQFLETSVEQEELLSQKDGTIVTFHDPCILAYDLGMSHIPRKIITALGFTLKEPVYSQRHTHCCGAGYGAKIGDRRLRDAVTTMRLNELRNAGADIYVTACPTCKSVLSEINMKYITELVAQRVIDKQ